MLPRCRCGDAQCCPVTASQPLSCPGWACGWALRPWPSAASLPPSLWQTAILAELEGPAAVALDNPLPTTEPQQLRRGSHACLKAEIWLWIPVVLGDPELLIGPVTVPGKPGRAVGSALGGLCPSPWVELPDGTGSPPREHSSPGCAAVALQQCPESCPHTAWAQP